MVVKIAFWVAVALLAVTALLVYRSRRIAERTKKQVEAWAQHNKYVLSRAQRRGSRGSPFPFSLTHAVYEITIHDQGRYRHGFLRCGRPKADAPKYARVEVRWAD